jgi:hypothetical protein
MMMKVILFAHCRATARNGWTTSASQPPSLMIIGTPMKLTGVIKDDHSD